MSNYNKKSHEFVWSAVERVCTRSAFFARALEIAGSISSYAMWQKTRGYERTSRFRSRDQLFDSLFASASDGFVDVVELGVASGQATRYWLDRVKNPDLRWHGFDIFTGLPEPWTRGGIEYMPAGAFDAGGRPPEIDDTRITWHVGLVEDTLPKVELRDGARLIVLFDLDIYPPTEFALWYLADRFAPGDILYFDEAYDAWNERRLIDEFLAAGHRLEPSGSTGIALATTYRGRGTR